MKAFLTLALIFSSWSCLLAQIYTDFLGAGHSFGVNVSTSNNANPSNDGSKSIDGFQVTDSAALANASRFLAQASLGYDYETIEMVAAMGFEGWLDEQFSLPRQSFTDLAVEIAAIGERGTGIPNFRSGWWNYAFRTPDQLRQRITYNLSEIFVVSGFGNALFKDVYNLSNAYYDVLGENSFGKYRSLLSAVSRNASMGIYLSHLNNPKADTVNNIHPDENYAREVMQLFSIGLYELNEDGSHKLDGNGNSIPTYDNEDIREYAKIFTGFGNGGAGGLWGRIPDYQAIAEFNSFVRTPMRIYDQWHDTGAKNLLNGQMVPAGQTGIQDFQDAMDNLSNHPNVGPFIGKALIQFLVSSNPSPQYIQRISQIFNNNGQGVRGDMSAVLKAILLDPEARNCTPTTNQTAGKLREPILRYTGLIKAFNPRINMNQGLIVDDMSGWQRSVGQSPMYSRSVFNFFLPSYQPQGELARANLSAPVFQIHNSSTSVAYINYVDFMTAEEIYLEGSNPILDMSDELSLVNNPNALVDRLNLLLACGQLSAASQSIIANAISQVRDPLDKLSMALYLVLISPDYAVLK
ncbi:MAG: DUF1800 family protein [Bacteroidota bacterium]